MDILYQDNSILVCIKPAGVLSTDEPGGVPELVRQTLGDPKACVRTVHRLDRVVSGLMVLARTPGAASKLSAQIDLRRALSDGQHMRITEKAVNARLRAQTVRTMYLAGGLARRKCAFRGKQLERSNVPRVRHSVGHHGGDCVERISCHQRFRVHIRDRE